MYEVSVLEHTSTQVPIPVCAKHVPKPTSIEPDTTAALDRRQLLKRLTNVTKAVVGLARLSRTAAPDPTAEELGWVSVELTAVRPFAHPVTLAAIKADPAFAAIALLRQSRLSVMPLTPAQFDRIVALGG